MSEPPYAQVICPVHSTRTLTFKEYVRQLACPDSRWVCPTCGACAVFDDLFFENLHERSGLTTQERSKLEHTYSHEEVKLLVTNVMQYCEDLEAAINCLGKPGSMAATVKAQKSRDVYLASIEPFKHLRERRER